MSIKKMSDLRVNDTARIKDGEEFIVIERVPEDRSSGYTTIEYKTGETKRFFTGPEYDQNPEVEFLGTAKRKISWE